MLRRVRTAVGIDIGGTKLAGAVVDTVTGNVDGFREIPTGAHPAGADVLAAVVSLAQELLSVAPGGVSSIGLGVCETVSPSGQITSANSWDWRGIDVATVLSQLAPCTVESDVRAAARAEARCGAGAGCNSFVYLSVGTGVACAFVSHGVVRVGERGNAMVFGEPTLEARSSGKALNALLGADLAGVIASGEHDGVLQAAAAEIGASLAVLVNALDPTVVVIGGGLGLNPRFRQWIDGACRSAIYAPDTRELPIAPAALGRTAGVVGAALAAAASRSSTARKR